MSLVTRFAMSIALVAALALLESNALAVDVDQNGVEDDVEKIWAERYKPSFFVNYGNPMEPEPVEILDRNEDGLLSIDDVSCWVTAGALDGTLSYEGNYCDFHNSSQICNNGMPFRNLRWGTVGWCNFSSVELDLQS